MLTAAGCVRRDGRNSDCKWPSASVGRDGGPRHLSADAEYAEDLAIRYADAHFGLHTPHYVSGKVYESARDRCMQQLFQLVAQDHGVSVAQVSASLGRNRAHIDVSETLPFLLLYCLAAAAVARILWARYPPHDQGWTPGVSMALFLSLAFAAGGTMVAEALSGLIESFRVGNSHMSYRLQRLLWAQHHAAMFISLLILFWLAEARAAMRRVNER